MADSKSADQGSTPCALIGNIFSQTSNTLRRDTCCSLFSHDDKFNSVMSTFTTWYLSRILFIIVFAVFVDNPFGTGVPVHFTCIGSKLSTSNYKCTGLSSIKSFIEF